MKNSNLGEGSLRTARYKLINFGFVEERDGKYRSIEIRLTDKGREAAKALETVRRLTKTD